MIAPISSLISVLAFVFVFRFDHVNAGALNYNSEKADEQVWQADRSLNDPSIELLQSPEKSSRAIELLGANYPELCKNRSRRSNLDEFDFNMNQFDSLNQIFKGSCIQGFQAFGNTCITMSIYSCTKSTYAYIENFEDLTNPSIDITMIDRACDPKGRHKDKKIGIAQVESLKEMEDLMVICDLVESSPCKNSGYFIKIYNNETCRYEPVLLQKINGSFRIEKNVYKNNETKYDFVCKYTLQPVMSKLSKRGKETAHPMVMSQTSQIRSSHRMIAALFAAWYYLKGF